jgi:hypothetical protein
MQAQHKIMQAQHKIMQAQHKNQQPPVALLVQSTVFKEQTDERQTAIDNAMHSPYHPNGHSRVVGARWQPWFGVPRDVALRREAARR